ncbi:MAG: hypothetical protein ACLRL4_10460 [Bifidobacterium bifidum]
MSSRGRVGDVRQVGARVGGTQVESRLVPDAFAFDADALVEAVGEQELLAGSLVVGEWSQRIFEGSICAST